jgi:hypothetical protein
MRYAAEEYLLDARKERDAIEVAVRKLCPLDNNEGYEDEDGDAVVYRCMNEDGDAFIEAESLAEAVEGMFASYDRVCEAFEAKCEESQRLTAEVARLRKFAEKMITPCEWGPSAFIEEDESDISDWALSHGLLVERVHAQPCEVEGCECDGSPTLLYFAWSPEAAALALPTNAPEAK